MGIDKVRHFNFYMFSYLLYQQRCAPKPSFQPKALLIVFTVQPQTWMDQLLTRSDRQNTWYRTYCLRWKRDTELSPVEDSPQTSCWNITPYTASIARSSWNHMESRSVDFSKKRASWVQKVWECNRSSPNLWPSGKSNPKTRFQSKEKGEKTKDYWRPASSG